MITEGESILIQMTIHLYGHRKMITATIESEPGLSKA